MRRRIIAVLAVAATLLLLGGGLVALRNASLLGAPAASPASVPPARLIVTTWVVDPSVTAGPYPGYRPRTTAITPNMVTSASAEPNPLGGTDWVVAYTLDARGTRIFAQLSTEAYDACGAGQQGSCAGSHVTMWLDLTQEDVDAWNTRAGDLYRPADQGGKLLSDPYIQSPITGGSGLIQGGFTRQEAMMLVARLHR
jgi:preprotein translocase subunit SecD